MVITIISLLAAAAVPTIVKVKRRSLASVIANDFRVFATAFDTYAHEVDGWPSEVDAGGVPPEMASRISTTGWLKPTALDGQFNWDAGQTHAGTNYRAVIAINSTDAAPVVQDADLLEAIDAVMDDGNLATGSFRLGADLPKAQVPYVSAEQLLKLLKSVEELGSAIVYPTEPEVRISGGPGDFMVRAKGDELHLVSWSKAHKGGVYTAEQIVAAITNEGGEEEFAAVASPTSSGGKSLREKATMALMGLAIVGINNFTIWFLTKPPRSLVGDYRALPAERAERVITQVAETY